MAFRRVPASCQPVSLCSRGGQTNQCSQSHRACASWDLQKTYQINI